MRRRAGSEIIDATVTIRLSWRQMLAG